MITDDPGTPGDGRWEINLATTWRHTDSGSENELPLVDINYGLGDHIQLKYEVPWVWLRENDGGSRSGLGNSSLGIKIRFRDAGDAGWQIATYPQVEFENPGSSSAQRGIAQDGTSLFLPFEFERDFKVVSFNFDAGRSFNTAEPDEWAAGCALGKELTQRLELMAELHASASPSLDESAVMLNLGARVAVMDSGTLLVSLGRDRHNELDERADLFGYVGWQVTFETATRARRVAAKNKGSPQSIPRRTHP